MHILQIMSGADAHKGVSEKFLSEPGIEDLKQGLLPTKAEICCSLGHPISCMVNRSQRLGFGGMQGFGIPDPKISLAKGPSDDQQAFTL